MFMKKSNKGKKTLSAVLGMVMGMSVFTSTAVTAGAVTEAVVNDETTAQILSAQTAEKATATAGKTLYLKPNANWIKSDARFAIYVTGNSGSQWVSMTDLGDGYYSADVPAGDYTSVQFARMDPKNATNSNATRWNYSGIMTIPTDKNNCFTLNASEWNDAKGAWSVYISKASLKKLYLKPNANWIKSDARFAMLVSDSKGNSEWVSMEDAGDGYYTAYVPPIEDSEYTKVKFARMDGNKSENTATSIWNYSKEMTFPTKSSTTNSYEIDDAQWNEGTGKWTVFTPTVHKIKAVYLKPNLNWTYNKYNKEARFSVYLYGGESPATWVSMTKVEDGNYKAVIPEGDYPKVQFARMDVNTTTNNWESLWNDSAEMEIPTNGTNRFVLGDDQWSTAEGMWDSITELKTLYLKPNANWIGTSGKSRFSMYLYGGSSSATWVSMEKTVNGIYKGDIPKGHYTKVIFVRMNPNTTENVWANNWNESTPQRIPVNTTDTFTLNANDWNSAMGVWSAHNDEELVEKFTEATFDVKKGDVVNYWVELTIPEGGADVAGWAIDMNYDKNMFTANEDFVDGYSFVLGNSAVDYALGLTTKVPSLPGSAIAQANFEKEGKVSIVEANYNGLKYKGTTTKMVCIQLVATASGKTTLSYNLRELVNTDYEQTYFDSTEQKPINGANIALKYSIK